MRCVRQMPKTIAGAVHRLADKGALACAMLALMLQLFTSSMGYASNGTWIEICSDFGTEYVQVDLADAPSSHQNGCPDCANCALCGAFPVQLTGNTGPHLVPMITQVSINRPDLQVVGPTHSRAWPETRGPPAATKKNADRALSAIMASIQENGGAL